MSDKYIIRNCPAFYPLMDRNECMGNDGQCQDYNDCKLKQIVQVCKDIECPCKYKGADCWECTESGIRRFADRILKLLDIQEVE